MIASGNKNGKIKIWEASTGQCIKQLELVSQKMKPMEWIVIIAFIRHGRFLIAGVQLAGSFDMRVWNPFKGQMIKEFKSAHTKLVKSIIYEDNSNSIISAGLDEYIRIWKANERKSIIFDLENLF